MPIRVKPPLKIRVLSYDSVTGYDLDNMSPEERLETLSLGVVVDDKLYLTRWL